VNVAVTLAAAVLLGAGFVLQQHAAERAPKEFFLRLALISDLLRRRRWLAGLAVMIAGELASAWSVSHLPLSVVEPLLTTSLLFALALAIPLSGQRLRATELVGVLILGGGVAALSVARAASSPAKSFGSPSGWFAAAAIAAVACGFVQAGRRRSGVARATFTGTAAGLVFGIADALTRQTVHIMNAQPVTTLLTSWPVYGLIGASVVGLWLMECAFNAAPLHASLPAVSAAEPAAGILLGVLVFGDAIRTSPAMIAVQASGLAALVLGVVLVARAPALTVLRPVRRLPLAPREHPSRRAGAQIVSRPLPAGTPGGPSVMLRPSPAVPSSAPVPRRSRSALIAVIAASVLVGARFVASAHRASSP
jgi:drug/metabolite transporter (DMT)-like permease